MCLIIVDGLGPLHGWRACPHVLSLAIRSGQVLSVALHSKKLDWTQSCTFWDKTWEVTTITVRRDDA